MSGRSTIVRNWPRYLLQWGTLAVLVAFAAGWIPAELPWLTAGGQTGNSLLQVLKGIAMVAAFALFSRLFCGYICPLGTAQDLLAKGRNSIRMKSLKIRSGSAIDKGCRIIKYLLLFGIFYVATYSPDIFTEGVKTTGGMTLSGEAIIWTATGSAIATVLLCIFIDMFFCRYLCPLGAVSNSMKFWVWMLGLAGTFYGANLLADMYLGFTIPWEVFLAAFCLLGYILEIFNGKPKLLTPHIVKDNVSCNNCGSCIKKCPYHIHLRDFHNAKVNHVDCTLCGECIAACPPGALNIGLDKPVKFRPAKYIPALIVIVIIVSGIWLAL